MAFQHFAARCWRTLADVLLLSGTKVNQTIVEDGWCWWYRKQAPGDRVLEQLEVAAREGKRGLWQDARPVPKQEFDHTGWPYERLMDKRHYSDTLSTG